MHACTQMNFTSHFYLLANVVPLLWMLQLLCLTQLGVDCMAAIVPKNYSGDWTAVRSTLNLSPQPIKFRFVRSIFACVLRNHGRLIDILPMVFLASFLSASKIIYFGTILTSDSTNLIVFVKHWYLKM
jgi:hypothetical protein